MVMRKTVQWHGKEGRDERRRFVLLCWERPAEMAVTLGVRNGPCRCLQGSSRTGGGGGRRFINESVISSLEQLFTPLSSPLNIWRR